MHGAEGRYLMIFVLEGLLVGVVACAMCYVILNMMNP